MSYKQTNTHTNRYFSTNKREKSDAGDDSSDHRHAHTHIRHTRASVTVVTHHLRRSSEKQLNVPKDFSIPRDAGTLNHISRSCNLGPRSLRFGTLAIRRSCQ